MSAIVDRVCDIDVDLYTWMLTCWVDVTNAGGAVGFVPPVDASGVQPTLDSQLAQVAAGTTVVGVLRVDGAPAGFGFLVGSDDPLFRHWATVLKLQVHPKYQGNGHGRRLLEGLAEIARSDGLAFLHLTYREGEGLGRFYESCGYVETGRVPGMIRVAPGDDRDSVLMVRPL